MTTSTSLSLRALLKTAVARARMGVPARAVTGLTPAAKALLVAASASKDATLVVVVPTDADVEQMTGDVRFFLAALEGASDAEVERQVASLYAACRATLTEWTDRLRTETEVFPERVTAFHDGMAVHGRFGKPCPVCGAPVQRIVYAENETNYCARCQTGGRILADRALSRLLKKSWPRSIDELG